MDASLNVQNLASQQTKHGVHPDEIKAIHAAGTLDEWNQAPHPFPRLASRYFAWLRRPVGSPWALPSDALPRQSCRGKQVAPRR